ncbi:hypothetical protein GCM10010271_46630 [Streptomyces kurssanovii]|nr:hypothetical protein GCM10010271_46630 [Streptomyces kurssanovii]
MTSLYANARAGNVRWRAGAAFAAAGLLPAALAKAAARLPQASSPSPSGGRGPGRAEDAPARRPGRRWDRHGTAGRAAGAAAVGTSLLVITANSLASLATRSGAAISLDWAVIGPFIAAAVLGAWDGKRLAAKVSGPRLQRVFAVLLLAVAAFMLVDAVA